MYFALRNRQLTGVAVGTSTAFSGITVARDRKPKTTVCDAGARTADAQAAAYGGTYEYAVVLC